MESVKASGACLTTVKEYFTPSYEISTGNLFMPLSPIRPVYSPNGNQLQRVCVAAAFCRGGGRGGEGVCVRLGGTKTRIDSKRGEKYNKER